MSILDGILKNIGGAPDDVTNLAKQAPKLVEDLTPKTLPLSVVAKVLQGLLAERISIRNLRTILETLVECGARSQDPQVLIGQVRIALSRQIMQMHNGSLTVSSEPYVKTTFTLRF